MDNKKATTSSPKQTVLKRLHTLLFGGSERKSGGILREVNSKDGSERLLAEALRALQPSAPLQQRVNFIKEFCEFVKSYRYAICLIICSSNYGVCCLLQKN